MCPCMQRRTFLLVLALTLGALGFAQAAFAADPIKIGMVAPLTGPGAEAGRFQTQRAKLNAGLHGHNIVKSNNGTVVFDKHIEFGD
jgi:hypothetical protein